MPYLTRVSLDTGRTRPFPYDVPAVKYARDLRLDAPVTFFVGENGSGKSTLLETIAFRLQLPHLNGNDYTSAGYAAAKKLVGHLDIEWGMERSRGFFFRAEDFGDLANTMDRRAGRLYNQLYDLRGEVPDAVIDAMIESANQQPRHMERYGQSLQAHSHGEAFLEIMRLQIKGRGIYLLDEPEAALSPTRQLALLYFLQDHLAQHNSQFLIATHAPILMALPGAQLYEITADGMEETGFEETEHYRVTRSVLERPGAVFGGP